MSNPVPTVVEGGEQTHELIVEEIGQLLRTKLFVPPIRTHRVARPRLVEQIHGGLDKTLTLISAPAGYGKTTLVSSWLLEAGVPSTWLSLDEDDNDPIRFLQYFISALHKIVPAIQLDLLGVLQGMQPAPYDALMNIVINEIAGRATPFVLVLDDLHTIHVQPVLQMLTYLLEHVPPSMHAILISRTDPPLPLSRLRARDQVVEIRADHLRFTPEEITIFLDEVMGLKLSADDIMALEARTEGWIAGLQLAAISMRGVDDLHGFVSAFTGSYSYIMDYLAEEVLKLQTERIRSFLLQTSILDRLSGPACEAVIGIRESSGESSDESLFSILDSQSILESLERSNLFLIPLDNERRWYRYHHLFADVLNRRLEQMFPDRLPDLHRRASHWYEQNGLIYDAIHHALMAGDQQRAAQLVDQNGCLLLMRGEVINLLKWIKAVEPHSQTYPWIAIQKAWALSLTGQLDQVEGTFQIAEQLISSLEPADEVRTMLGAIIAARAYQANLHGESSLAAGFARQALESLPISNNFSCSLRSVATSILGDASWMSGNLVEAGHAYADAVRIGQAAGNIHMVIIANANLADVLMEQGQLQQAARKYSETLQMATLPDGQISPLTERVYAGLGRVSYEWNHLEAAAEYTHQCIELSRRWGSIEFQAAGHVMLAGLEHIHGNPEGVQEAMRAVQLLASEYPLTPWRSIGLKSALARLWIAQGILGRASDLIQESGIRIETIPDHGITRYGEILYLQEPMVLTLLRLHLARGDYDKVLALSGELLQKLEQTNRMGRIIEILILQSLAFQGKEDIARALTALEKALSLAQPEGYVRVFLDEGEPIYRLLKASKLKVEAYLKQYVENLISAFYMQRAGQRTRQPSPFQAGSLIEPVTWRELEVLKLIEAGCSNQEIAEKLVISIATVKRHISNIYTKLGASSRTQVVSRGRELNLLE